jgi:hypothetical protein
MCTWVDIRVIFPIGDLSYFEAVNKETLKNAFLRLQEMGVLVYRKGPSPPPAFTGPGAPPHPPPATTKGSENITWVALSLNWCPLKPLPALPKPAVKEPVSRLARFRRNPFAKSEQEKKVKDIRVDEGGAMLGGDSNISSKSSSSKETSNWPPEEAMENFLESYSKHKPEGRLWDLCEHIGRFRREGKNRRDTATVASRVLRLATMTRALVLNEGAGGKSKRGSKI